MSHLRRDSYSPTQVGYRDPDNLNCRLSVKSTVKPVRRNNAPFNHNKKVYKLTDIVQVGDSGVYVPVVLELSWSAEVGVSPDKYKKILDKALESCDGVAGYFITDHDEITID